MQSLTRKQKVLSSRKCFVTGVITQKSDLIRFVIDPKNHVIADVSENLPGRGYWVKAERTIVIKAIKKNLFSKTTKKSVFVDINLLETIEIQVKKNILNQISLSRKAGMTIFGFEKIKSSLSTKKIPLLIQAMDGSIRERARIVTKSIPNIIDDCLIGSELGKVFGREKVIHCAILQSAFVENIIFSANRLNNLKNPVPPCNNIYKPN